MSYTVRALGAAEFPAALREIPQPPKQLWLSGTLPDPSLKLLAVVGSRKYSTYGKQVVDHLISGLAGYPVGIVSGLALGIDALAHEAALQHQLYTLAIPGSGLDPTVLYPATNRRLATRIIDAGGGLLSEYTPHTTAAKWTFPQRNRLMAGLADATLLIEASEKSGTLITARLAVEYNRELLAVPGSIFSKNSLGVHQFLKLGATPVTTATDILDVLQLEPITHTATKVLPSDLSESERVILTLLYEPLEKDTLIRASQLPAATANVLLMEMEMKGLITAEQNVYRCIV